MVKDLLTAAGVQERGSRFTKPPAGTYAVWFDHVTAGGADGQAPSIFRHDITLELYSPKQDPQSEAAIEQQLGLRGLEWEKGERYWIQTEQIYQTVYDFSYTEKRRIL